jgi:hypothetical protein
VPPKPTTKTKKAKKKKKKKKPDLLALYFLIQTVQWNKKAKLN